MNKLIKLYYILIFVLYYLKAVIQANLTLAAYILTPELKMSTAIIDIKLHTRNENYILAMSNLISMTPGSLTLNYNEETNTLKVHVMYVGDLDAFQKSALNLQRMVQRIF